MATIEEVPIAPTDVAAEAPVVEADEPTEVGETENLTIKPKRGRPKGSTNKPKAPPPKAPKTPQRVPKLKVQKEHLKRKPSSSSSEESLTPPPPPRTTRAGRKQAMYDSWFA